MEETNRIQDSVDNITDDTRALIAATADAAEEVVEEVRDEASSVIESAKDTYAALQKKAIEGAKATDKLVRENPYQAIGIAAWVGVLIGYLLSRRDS